MKTREELLDRYENEPTARKFSKSDKVLSFTPKELKEVLDAPTEKQANCPYCHDDGSRLDNESLWGSEVILDIDDYDAMVINLSKCQLVSTDALHAFSIKNCPMCGRKLGNGLRSKIR